MGEKERSGEKRFKAKRKDDWAFSPGEQAVTFILHPCGPGGSLAYYLLN